MDSTGDSRKIQTIEFEKFKPIAVDFKTNNVCFDKMQNKWHSTLWNSKQASVDYLIFKTNKNRFWEFQNKWLMILWNSNHYTVDSFKFKTNDD